MYAANNHCMMFVPEKRRSLNTVYLTPSLASNLFLSK